MSDKKQQSNKGVDKSRDAILSGGRKRGSPAHAFMSHSGNQNTEKKQDDKKNSGKHLNEQSNEEETGKSNKKPEQYSGKSNSLSDKENKTSNIDRNSETKMENSDENSEEVINDQPIGATSDHEQDNFWDLIDQEKKKKTVEETHTRQTYLIRNDLLKELNKVSRKQGKGFKTKVINYALEQFLNDINNEHRK